MTDFIGAYSLDNTEVCDRIVDFFEASPDKYRGIVSTSRGTVYLPEVKDCTEVTLLPKTGLYSDYMLLLQKCVDQYISAYPHCNQLAPWGVTDLVKIKKYQPNEAYFQTHCERATSAYPNSSRHLVWMTYLNDVSDQGGTEFVYQNKVVQPKKGLTLIWPVDWTHVHRGIPSPTQVKYVVGGWFNFLL